MSRASEIAYQEIRGRILSGSIPASTQLKEEELATLCGVSRTPVREALRRLEAEMLVRRTDSQRSFVPDWSRDEVEEIFALRCMLESHAAKLAAARITPVQLDELRRCNDRLDRAVYAALAPDLEGFVEHNNDFHCLVLEAARSERLIKIRNLIVEQMIVRRTALRYDRAALIRSHTDHQELVDAFAHGDAEWAGAIMTSHIRRAAQTFGDVS